MLTSDLNAPTPLLLDTHIWVWASGGAGGPAQFAPAAVPAIENAARDRRLYVCAASVWEIALKAARGVLLISGDLHAWVRQQRRYPGVRVLPIDTKLCIDSTHLPVWTRTRDGKEHRDPNDRFLATAARRLNAVLVTCDEEILFYAEQGHLQAYDARC